MHPVLHTLQYLLPPAPKIKCVASVTLCCHVCRARHPTRGGAVTPGMQRQQQLLLSMPRQATWAAGSRRQYRLECSQVSILAVLPHPHFCQLLWVTCPLDSSHVRVCIFGTSQAGCWMQGLCCQASCPVAAIGVHNAQHQALCGPGGKV